MSYLYHYTTLDSLAKILENMKLKFGALPTMNDFTESSKDSYTEFYDDKSVWMYDSKIKSQLKRVKQLSLTQDGRFKGYAINAMWGHYADSGEGCCIAFNKDKIIECCKKYKLYYAVVKYNGIADDIMYNPTQNDVYTFFKLNRKKLFFLKSSDWAYEQEFRIINLNAVPKGVDFFDVADAINYIILHTNAKYCAFEKPAVKTLMSRYPQLIFLEYAASQMWGNTLRDIIGNSQIERLNDAVSANL